MENKKKFEVGERVVYKISTNKGLWAVVLDTNASQDEFGQLLLVSGIKIKILDNGNVKVVSEYELDKVPKGTIYLNLDMLECECGLKFVRDGGNHSDWCRLSPFKKR